MGRSKRHRTWHGEKGAKGTTSYGAARGRRFWIQDCVDLVSDSLEVAHNVDQTLRVWLTVSNVKDDHQADKPAAYFPPIPTTDSPSDRRAFIVDQTAADSDSLSDVCATAIFNGNSNQSDPPVIFIQRAEEPMRDDSFPLCPSASNRSTPRKASQPFRNLPNGDCGDGIVNPHPQTVVSDKYWSQRKRLFSKFDCGIQLDSEGWFSVTPEAIANHIANKMIGAVRVAQQSGNDDDKNSDRRGLIVLDAFAGVGGNAIAFALHHQVELVVCVDTCRDRLQLAAHNCRVYSVPPEKVLFVHGNTCQVLERYKRGRLLPLLVTSKCGTTAEPTPIPASDAKVDVSCYTIGGYEILPLRLDAIFLSPPWGGPQYQSIGPRHFGLSNIEIQRREGEVEENCGIIDGAGLLRLAVAAVPANALNIGYYLPRNLNGIAFAQDCYGCGIRGSIEMEQNVLNDKLKTITVYISCG
jgi:trimethylguanosine synthase